MKLLPNLCNMAFTRARHRHAVSCLSGMSLIEFRFSPITYKVPTLGAGVMQIAFLPFLFASVIGCGTCFFLVAAFMKWGRSKMAAKLRDCIEWMGGDICNCRLSHLPLEVER